MHDLRFDYTLKIGLRSGDFDLVPLDVDVLRVLFSTAVVSVENMTLADYYAGIFDAAVSRMRTIEPVDARGTFVKTAVRLLERDYAALRDPGRLAAISAGDFAGDLKETLGEAVARLSFLGSALPEEAMVVSYDLCRLQGGDIGALREGTVLVRRTSPVATVVWPARELWFDGAKVVAAPEAPAEAAPLESRAEHIVTHGQEPTQQRDFLGATIAICDVLSLMPEYGPIFDVIGKTLSLFDALRAKKQDFDRTALAQVRSAFKQAYVEAQMAHIDRWANTLGGLHARLRDATDPSIFLDYLRALETQTVLGNAGSVQDVVYQLNRLFQNAKPDEMDLREDILKGLVLSLSHQHMIQRDIVATNVQLANLYEGSSLPAESKKHRAQAEAAHREYDYLVTKADVRPSLLQSRIEEWKRQRGCHDTTYSHDPCDSHYSVTELIKDKYPYNVTSYCKNSYLYYTFVVKDKGRFNQELVWCNWDQHPSGVSWARKRVSDYQTFINREVQLNLDPLWNECAKMTAAFDKLKLY